MTLEYGKTETYEHELSEENLKWLVKRTNRSDRQTLFLFQLVDGDFEQLKKLETLIKNCFYTSCPGNKEEAEKILETEPKSNYFSLTE